MIIIIILILIKTDNKTIMIIEFIQIAMLIMRIM